MQPISVSQGPVVTPALAPPQLAIPSSAHLAVGIGFLVAELFVLQTRFFDFFLSGFRIPMLIFLMLSAFIVLGLSSQMWNFTKRTPALLLLQLFWMAFATVFSTWRSNSVTNLTGYLYLCVVGLAVITFIDTPARFQRILMLFGLFYAMAALMGFFVGRQDLPRLQLTVGTYSDPNIYALCIVAGIPVIYWIMTTGNVLMRLTALLLSLAMYWIVLKTGSRGAFISLGIIMLMALYYASLMRKVLMVTGLLLAMVVASMFLSTYSKNRLFTLFKSDLSQDELQSMTAVERNAATGDVGSSEDRWQLLIDSLSITGRHPLVGVGPGNFGDARWQMHLAQVGRNIAAHTTHNTYTQFSSEAGVLGLLIFIAQIIDAFRNLKAVRKWNQRDGYQPPAALLSAAHYLRFALAAICVGMFFLSLAYTGPFCILVGLTLALRNTVEKDWRRYAMARQPAVAAVPGLTPQFQLHSR